MTRKFVTLHDEEWIKENCVLVSEGLVPKIYTEYTPDVSVLLTGLMYKQLVGKTLEVIDKHSKNTTAMGYLYKKKHGTPWNIPTWLIKAYLETQE